MATVSIANTATSIIAKNSGRGSLVIENVDASKTVFWGVDNTVTTANGMQLLAGERMIWTYDGDFEASRFFYRGAFFGIVASGTADVRVQEFTDQY